MWLLPGVLEHALQVNLLAAVRTDLLLANYTPASNAKLMKSGEMPRVKIKC